MSRCAQQVVILCLATFLVPNEATHSGQTLTSQHDGSSGQLGATEVILRGSRHQTSTENSKGHKDDSKSPPEFNMLGLRQANRPDILLPEVPKWFLKFCFFGMFIFSIVAFIITRACTIHGINVQQEKDAEATLKMKERHGPPQHFDENSILESNQADEATLEYWIKSSGMHTVQDWCESYNEHPGCWGALLMIHGADEVTNRLRSKVESYALYAGLFVAGSIAAIMQPPESCMDCLPEEHKCRLLRRFFLYGLILGLVAHVLCILLAMSFVNALNETARDADVFRLFARGQGYYATVRCENTFAFGALCNTIAIVAVAISHLGVEVLIVLCVFCPIAAAIYAKTTVLLFKNGSILQYWRWQDHPDDPYDLSVPVQVMRERAKHALDL